ncbi:hypothetical protein DPM19_25040 [Actinomadura craniellae]|uniref:DUF6879 domain-containing protein n=1 Tax=Actinomadura craniellae TaxID=2231787 RepID=A0A365H047_9ACTN|nr:DUF6879 family protein [Actinomadura craniellae]RAY12416.1 hypothetical protein DPM19_25040 [Actinomadura craniellae]
MLERVRDLPAVDLDAQGYLDDFWRHHERIDGAFWKLERIQTFREPEDPGWVAMISGDWGRALALIEEQRPATVSGRGSHRLRVVERPVTPYVQWELHALRPRAEAGAQDVRVLDAAEIRHLETGRTLPELVFLGTEVMYEVLYDGTGTHSGGRRHDDPGVIAACHRELAELHAKGEDLRTYFDREIAPLPAPGGTG